MFIKELIKKIAFRVTARLKDETMLRIVFPLETKEKFDLKNPISYNQKLQWYKLKYRDPKMIKCVDKVLVREYVDSKGYGEILNGLYGVYQNPEKINFDELPNKFVLKVNNAMGTNIFVENKKNIDREKIRNQLKNWLNKTPLQVWFGKEWAYKHVEPKIICEEYIDAKGEELIDYKFHCFNGVPEIVQVSMDKGKQHRINFYDSSWNYIHAEHIYPTKGDVLEKPKKFDKMLEIAKDLAADFPHVRVDFYNIDEKIIFGELTFYTSAGFGSFKPNNLNIHMGDLFQLPNEKVF